MTSPLVPDLWNVLHDGGIDEISGSVPGDVRLVVDIEYLRKRFEDPGDSIHITLHHCTRFSFQDCDAAEPMTELAAISDLQLGILSTDSGDEIFCDYGVSSHYGRLSFAAAGFSVTLDSGRAIGLEDLVSVAKTYWDAFGNRSS